MSELAINLPEEQLLFLTETVRSGRFASESEVVAQAVAEFAQREAARRADLEQLRGELAVGIAQLDAGQGRKWDVEALLARGRATRQP